jgi:hypothetical protein
VGTGREEGVFGGWRRNYLAPGISLVLIMGHRRRCANLNWDILDRHVGRGRCFAHAMGLPAAAPVSNMRSCFLTLT